MVKQLLNHIQRHNLCKTTDKILLAVSGGMDSMVMLHLFCEAGIQVGVIHCNFQLRGEDSMADEALVNTVCARQRIPFFVKRFDTLKHASNRNISTQMAARELRYEYFREVAQDNGYPLIATAHHLNDSLETILLHFTRGTGIEGLTGIPVKNENVIRPLLFASREMISEYAHFHHLAWREDKTNESDDYQRNFIRHQVIPRLKEINPSLEETFLNTQHRLQGTDHLVKYFIAQFRKQAVRILDKELRIDIRALRELPYPDVILWEILKEKGFNYSQCQEIVIDHQSGKFFLSATHVLTVDREQYFVHPKDASSASSFMVDSSTSSIQTELGSLHFESIPKDRFQLSRKPGFAQLDLQKVKYPLLWRTWKEGDSFVPLGMKHTKKLSDFLIDIRMPLPEKEKVSVIESAGTIIWVVGHRIHDHFKVTEQTLQVLTVDFTK